MLFGVWVCGLDFSGWRDYVCLLRVVCVWFKLCAVILVILAWGGFRLVLVCLLGGLVVVITLIVDCGLLVVCGWFV